jgi:hypothetical protein
MPLRPSTDTIRNLARAYGFEVDGGAGLHEVARGAMGRIWRLERGLGLGPHAAALAVKELFWGGHEHAVRAEVAFRDAATASGQITAPASLRTVDGTYLHELPDRTLVRVFTWAEGTVLAGPDPEATGWLGRTLGALHRLAHPAGGGRPDPWYWRCPSPADWDALIATGAPWAEALAARRARLLSLSERVTPDDGPGWIWCHRDVLPSNVLCGASGFTLLDWENGGPGRPDRELASALLNWSLDGDGLAVMLSEYRRGGGPVTRLDEDAFSMGLAKWINYLHVQAWASLDQGLDGDHRAHAVLECGRTLDGLPDIDRLEDLRAAANALL